MPGPSPRPTEIKKLHNVRPGRINDAEPKPTAIPPDCPEWLNQEAKDFWYSIVPMLMQMKVLTSADQIMLAALCQNYIRAVECERVISKEGMTFTTPNGYVGIRPEASQANKYWSQVVRLAGHFGLSPAERSRIHIDKTQDVDPYSAFKVK